MLGEAAEAGRSCVLARDDPDGTGFLGCQPQPDPERTCSFDLAGNVCSDRGASRRGLEPVDRPAQLFKGDAGRAVICPNRPKLHELTPHCLRDETLWSCSAIPFAAPELIQTRSDS